MHTRNRRNLDKFLYTHIIGKIKPGQIRDVYPIRSDLCQPFVLLLYDDLYGSETHFGWPEKDALVI